LDLALNEIRVLTDIKTALSGFSCPRISRGSIVFQPSDSM